MNNDNQPSKHKKNHHKSIFTILVILIPIILALLVIAGIFLGRLNISIKNPNQTVTVNTIICNDGIINRYNTAVQSKTLEEYNNNLKSVVDEIEALSDYEKDPSCSFILYIYYSQNIDVIKARQYANAIKEQGNNGNYLNDNIINLDSMQHIENYVRSLEGGSNNISSGGAG